MTKKKIIAKQIGEDVSHPISDAAANKLAAILQGKDLKKNEYLVREGEINHQLFYVEKGLVRQFSHKNGKEITEHFALERSMFLNIDSFFTQGPTDTTIEALEPVTLYGMPHEPLMELVSNHQEINSLYRCIIEKMLTIIHKKIFAFRFETASERYVRLLRERPDIIKRVQLIHIASYLRMSPETLSRVRAGLLNGTA
ncbi:MAG: Crp/Fnr family transcriptional regulator [Tannerellaceae bacterium]|jgi:CRP-like cAMP-binding protein|nr:Crp/Fnr family transcriptional regulator [Tannerellaceae bacterium]